MKKHRQFLFLLISLLLFGLQQPGSIAHSQDTKLQILETAEGLSISWANLVVSGSDAYGAPIISGWDQKTYTDYRLPLVLLTLERNSAQPANIQLTGLSSSPWSAALSALPPISPHNLMGDERPELQNHIGQLPEKPVTILRQSSIQGHSIVVVALSPLFDSGNGPEFAYSVQAILPGLRQITTDSLEQRQSSHQIQSVPTTITAPPPQPAANQALAMITTHERGMARMSGASLAQAGIDLSTLNLETVQLFYNNSPLSIEIIDGGDGHLDPQDEIRFFSAGYMDRWNKEAVYWLVQASTAGQRISSRMVMPGNAPLSNTGQEQGLWRLERRYDSLLPGPLGDYWYAEDMKTGGYAIGTPPSEMIAPKLQVVLTPTLALAPGPLHLTLYATAYTRGPHTLRLTVGSAQQTISWTGTGNVERTFQFAAQNQNVLIEQLPGQPIDGLEIQALGYIRPIQLNTNNKGALFTGYDALSRYQIQGTTASTALYDVSNPNKPVRLQGQYANGSYVFEDRGAHTYVLTGSQTLRDASITKYKPINLAADLHLQAIYIAPASLQAGLAPLIAHRKAQGISAGVVDVQHIYNTWSGGHVSPDAIRSFLRYAYATWSTPPTAFVLVGDGSADPFDYLRHGVNNVTLIPPYLAHVDPWIGETACDACYAQLDGDSPLDDLMPDLHFGRFPVKTPAELDALVKKILSYEQISTIPSWQSGIGLVADNYNQADGSFDQAGDFGSMADRIAARVPPGIAISRLYYDPGPTRPQNQPWREPDEDRARQRTLDLINNGAALITYIGHSHQWQWAVTNPQSQTSSYLLGLYDVDGLKNTDRLAVIRELTCLTSAFQTPAFGGTSIDERLLLMPGGAAAVWGPSGLGVAHGHDTLAIGFDKALWQANGKAQSLGTLTKAGLMELYGSTACCNDIFRTYVLLGDPLTQLRVARALYLPVIGR